MLEAIDAWNCNLGNLFHLFGTGLLQNERQKAAKFMRKNGY